MAKDECILNFSQPAVKRMVLAHIKTLQGMYWFELRRCRDQRTLAQNAYLFGVIYPHVRDGMEEVWGETLSVEQVHVFLKKKFLAQPVVNRQTGEVMGETVGSSADLDVKQFGEYIDNIIRFASEFLNIEIPLPCASTPR